MNISDEQINEIVDSAVHLSEMYKYIEELEIDKFPFCFVTDDNLKRVELKWTLNYFEEVEDYEKCAKIKEVMDSHYIATPEQEKQVLLSFAHQMKEKNISFDNLHLSNYWKDKIKPLL